MEEVVESLPSPQHKLRMRSRGSARGRTWSSQVLSSFKSKLKRSNDGGTSNGSSVNPPDRVNGVFARSKNALRSLPRVLSSKLRNTKRRRTEHGHGWACLGSKSSDVLDEPNVPSPQPEVLMVNSPSSKPATPLKTPPKFDSRSYWLSTFRTVPEPVQDAIAAHKTPDEISKILVNVTAHVPELELWLGLQASESRERVVKRGSRITDLGNDACLVAGAVPAGWLEWVKTREGVKFLTFGRSLLVSGEDAQEVQEDSGKSWTKEQVREPLRMAKVPGLAVEVLDSAAEGASGMGVTPTRVLDNPETPFGMQETESIGASGNGDAVSFDLQHPTGDVGQNTVSEEPPREVLHVDRCVWGEEFGREGKEREALIWVIDSGWDWCVLDTVKGLREAVFAQPLEGFPEKPEGFKLPIERGDGGFARYTREQLDRISRECCDCSLAKSHGMQMLRIVSANAPNAQIGYWDLGEDLDDVSLQAAIGLINTTAGKDPCVISCSLEELLGSHDEWAAVPFLLDSLHWKTGPRAFVVAAGNSHLKDGYHASFVLTEQQPEFGFSVKRIGCAESKPEAECAKSERGCRFGYTVELWYDFPVTETPLSFKVWELETPETLEGVEQASSVELDWTNAEKLCTKVGDYAEDESPYLERGDTGSFEVPELKQPKDMGGQTSAVDELDAKLRVCLELHLPERSLPQLGSKRQFRVGAVNLPTGSEVKIDAWSGRGCAVFREGASRDGVDDKITLSNMAGGVHTVVVAASDNHTAAKEWPKSGSGPTRSGKYQPSVLAPGKFDARKENDTEGVHETGTSHATAVVAALVARHLGRQSEEYTKEEWDIRTKLKKALGNSEWNKRHGYGFLDSTKASEFLKEHPIGSPSQVL